MKKKSADKPADDPAAAAPRQNSEREIGVGARVRIDSDAELGSGDSAQTATGVIVDDYGEVLAAHDHYGRDWGITKRWAIALDTGALVFRNSDELKPLQ